MSVKIAVPQVLCYQGVALREVHVPSRLAVNGRQAEEALLGETKIRDHRSATANVLLVDLIARFCVSWCYRGVHSSMIQALTGQSYVTHRR